MPLFYLVDSIMKRVGGSYVDLFGKHIDVVFQRTFNEVKCFPASINNLYILIHSLFQLNETDRARLDFLLSTWEERRLWPNAILSKMRNYIGTRIVIAPHRDPNVSQYSAIITTNNCNT